VRFSAIAIGTFACLLAFFLAFRAVLMAAPIDVIDPFQKSAIGTLVALLLLVLQPFACRLTASRLGASSSGRSWAFGGGFVSSLLLQFPALILFME
jgi:hypothetical protein